MSGRVVVAAAVVAALVVAVPAAADPSQTQSKTVTATGTGQVRVHAKNRHSNSSIAAAVASARKAAVARALGEAHEFALAYAKGGNMTLGAVISITDQQAGFYGPGPGTFFGPFGANRYCGTTQQVIGPITPGVRPTFKKVYRCVVPRFAFSTLTVTYSAS
jgi:uncharacterized protein YggE